MVNVTDRAGNDLKCVKGRKTEIKPNQIFWVNQLVVSVNQGTYLSNNHSHFKKMRR